MSLLKRVWGWIDGWELLIFKARIGAFLSLPERYRYNIIPRNRSRFWRSSLCLLLLAGGLLGGCIDTESQNWKDLQKGFKCVNGWAYKLIDRGAVLILDPDAKPMSCAKWRAQQPK